MGQPRRTQPAPWEVTPFSPFSDEREQRCCPHCLTPLSIHQPDPAAPNRMLATCEGCEAWFYIDVTPDGAAALLVHLPRAMTTWTATPVILRELAPGLIGASL